MERYWDAPIRMVDEPGEVRASGPDRHLERIEREVGRAATAITRQPTIDRLKASTMKAA